MVGQGVVRELYVISRMDLGGAERIVLQLASSAGGRGAQASVASSGGVWVSALEAAGVEHHTLPRMRRNPLRLAQTVWVLSRVIRREQPDVVHAVNVKATAVAAAAMRLARRRGALVTSMHGVPAGEYPAAAKVLGRASTRVIACAPAVASHLVDAGLAADRIDVVTNAVALTPATSERVDAMRARTGAPDGRPLVVGVGRLVDQKDWPVWIAVAAAVPEAWFALAGDGPLAPVLAEQARAAGNVTMLGRVDDVAALHGAATAFLSTSQWEGLPLSLLEALSLGVPAVVTAVDGVTDAVPSDAAVFVSAGDVEGIARSLRDVLSDAARRDALRAAGARVTAGSDADDVVRGYAAVHEAACRTTGRTG